jgi:hypothetical protein
MTSMKSWRLLVVVAVAFSVIGGTAAAAGMAQTKTRPVRSTLDGKGILPHRIHWYVKVRRSSGRVRKVDFRIDGKLHWTEHTAPYSYGDDGNWLVTTWLPPGRHVFTARVITRSGKTFRDTVRAHTVAPPPVPDGLAGTRWQRVVAGGKWVLTIDETGWRIADPFGGKNYIDVVYPAAGTLQARNGIWTRNPTAAEQANGGAHEQEGNGWCADTNATDTYHYTANGNKLTLTLVGAEHCGTPPDGEAGIWAGTWTPAG